MKLVKRKKTNQIILVVLALAAVVSLAIVTKTTFFADKDNSEVLVLGVSGGMCSNGPCSRSIGTLYASGRFDGHKPLSDGDMKKVNNLINDFDKSKYNAKGDCGVSVFDGSDYYLKFKKHGKDTFEPCAVDKSVKNNPLQEIIDILKKY